MRLTTMRIAFARALGKPANEKPYIVRSEVIRRVMATPVKQQHAGQKQRPKGK